MTNRKWLHIAFGVVILGLLSTASTGAVWNPRRTTYITFDRAVQIPGMTLPAGTYAFEVADSDRLDVVRIMNQARTKVYLTTFTRFVSRPNAAKLDTAIVFAEHPAGTAPVIRDWYPQDELTGRQFIY